MGIDPGHSITGFSILKIQKSCPSALDLGFLELAKIKSISKRLLEFEKFLTGKITQHSVTSICLETPFLGKNAQTFLKLGFLRGILLLTGERHGLEVLEFAPTTVKQSVTGYGGASKDQVARAIMMLFPQISGLKKTAVNDVTDALAVGLCGLWTLQNQARTKPFF